MHLIIVDVDVGRSDVLSDPVSRQAFHCIRCSACLNVCPVFERTCGHAYGAAYQARSARSSSRSSAVSRTGRRCRRPIYMTGSVVVVLVAFPFFAALETRSFALMLVAAIVIVNISHDLNDAVESSCFSELFGPGCRYTGTAMGHQLGAAHGGFAPLIAGSLSAAAGRSWVPVAAYVAVSCLISTACVLASRETVHRRVARQRERPSSGAALSPALAEGRCSIA